MEAFISRNMGTVESSKQVGRLSDLGPFRTRSEELHPEEDIGEPWIVGLKTPQSP
jgi:hypothetical protein